MYRPTSKAIRLQILEEEGGVRRQQLTGSVVTAMNRP